MGFLTWKITWLIAGIIIGTLFMPRFFKKSDGYLYISYGKRGATNEKRLFKAFF